MIGRLSSDVQSRAQAVLQKSPIFGLRRLVVEQQGDVLTILGNVSSFYHKQLAQEVVRAIAGSTAVVNRVRVEYDETAPHEAGGT